MAIEKMIRAIHEYEITGLETTLGFCNYVMHHDAFRSGKFDTGFVGKYFKPEVLTGTPDPDEEKLRAQCSFWPHQQTQTRTQAVSVPVSKWKKNRIWFRKLNMVEIKPLRAWRYNQNLSNAIDDLTSPLMSFRKSSVNTISKSIQQHSFVGAARPWDAPIMHINYSINGSIGNDRSGSIARNLCLLPILHPIRFVWFKELCRKGFVWQHPRTRMGGWFTCDTKHDSEIG